VPIIYSLLLFFSGVAVTILLELLALEQVLAPIRGLFQGILGL
jgi:hypothetical protein